MAEHGTKWSLIVKLIPGRTDNAIKNRWNSAARKLVRQQRRGAGLDDCDVTAIGAQALAKHLLATGLDPRMPRPMPPKPPRVKRKLAVANAASKAPKMLEGGGLDLLCRLAPSVSADEVDERTASPRVVRAAMSLGGFLCVRQNSTPPDKSTEASAPSATADGPPPADAAAAAPCAATAAAADLLAGLSQSPPSASPV